MPAPHQLFPFIEGVIGSLGTTMVQEQGLTEWYQGLRKIMLSYPWRNYVTFEFDNVASVLPAGSLIPAANLGPNVIFGVIVGQNSADAERDQVCIGEGAAAVAFSGSAVPANTVTWMFQPPAATVDGTYEWHAFLFPTGLYGVAGPEVAADGRDGTDPAANDIQVWVLVLDL